MAKPVFVLGMGRSGTTWISNLLLQHSRIAGIRGERGIHESSYFSVVDGRFGPLDDAVNFVEFAEVMAASYLFRSAGVDAAFLLARYPSSYAEIFRAAMDHNAEAAGADCWIEKTPLHALYGQTIAGYYPDARFILIERDLRGVLRSRLALLDLAALNTRGKRDGLLKRWGWIAMWVTTWHHYRNTARRLGRDHPERTLATTFAALKADPEAATREMCGFLDLEFEPDMVNSPFPANTSFKDRPEGRAEVLSGPDGAWLSLWNVAMGLLPAGVLAFCYDLGTRGERRRARLPFYFFRELPDTPTALSEKL